MSRVEHMMNHFVINGRVCMKFCKEDIGAVFGIPIIGRSVLEEGALSKDKVNKMMVRYFGAHGKENRSIKVAQEVLERCYDGIMSLDEEDCFWVSFVIYVMSTLLAPGAKHDYVVVDYWNALQEPSLIRTFDWSDYVIHRLKDGVVKLKSDMKTENKILNITGCSIFLQVYIILFLCLV